MENKKPEHLKVLKIIGIIGVVVGIVGFILLITGFGDFETNNFMIGMFLGPFGMFIGIACLMRAFSPELAKGIIKTSKYIQQENKEDLKDIVNTSADISKDAIKTVVKSVKEGIKDSKFCKHCGAEIDADSKFCSECGKPQ